MATVRFEFMSPEWIAMAREQIAKALANADLSGIRFTLCEEFKNPPAHLRRAGRDTIGFCVRVQDGAVQVDDRLEGDADVTVTSDYADALAIARDPEAASADPTAMAERVADGRVTVGGDPSSAPPVLQQLDIHRLLAGHTA